MATAIRPPRDHKLLMTSLYKQGNSEEEIAEELCNAGVDTTFWEVLQHLETTGVIPCPSPVHSKDEDNATHQDRRRHRAKIGVTCYHGETSHISRTNLAHIPSNPTPIEKYQQDTQKYEEFACGYRQPPVESLTESTLLVLDSDSENDEIMDGDISAWLKQHPQGRRDVSLSAWLKQSQQAKRDRDQMDGSISRKASKAKVRCKNRTQK